VRTAVIVAAGKGTRLADGSHVPKPLRPVVGVPLIARVMRAAAKADITHFVVVIGHQADAMRAGLPPLVPAGCSLDLVENPRFEEPNGVSLRVGLDGLEGPIALLMADHLFTPDRLANAARHYEATGRNLLVVEEAATFHGDMDDATCVRRDGDRIIAIAKHLEGYDAIDTGMFVLDAAAVREALDSAGPSPSISDGMRRLAVAGLFDALALTGGRWQDVDTPEDIPAAERMLYASLRKPNDGFLARHVNRRISLALSTRLWRVGLTPNVASLATLLIGLAAGWAFSVSAAPTWSLLGATLFQLQSILDGVDGELARLLHRESRAGFWLDVTCDNLTHAAVFAGLAHGQAVDGGAGPWGLLGVLAVTGVAASFLATAPLLRRPRQAGATLTGGPTGILGKLADGLARRDFTYLLFPLAALGWLGGFLWAAAIGSWVYASLVCALRWTSGRAAVPVAD